MHNAFLLRPLAVIVRDLHAFSLPVAAAVSFFLYLFSNLNFLSLAKEGEGGMRLVCTCKKYCVTSIQDS